MKFAVSVANATNLNGIIHLVKVLSKLGINHHVYIRCDENMFQPIEGFTFTGTRNPFFHDGKHIDPNFYVAKNVGFPLLFQPTLYSWSANDSFIRKDNEKQPYDAVIALEHVHALDFQRVGVPDYGTIACNDELGQHPLSANFSRWIARPSDYSRLVLGWKFFRFVDQRQLHFELHDQHIELNSNRTNYYWKYWLDVQHVKVRKL